MKTRSAPFLPLIRRVVINPALRFTALNQLIRLVLGPVVLVALPVFLSAEELGFWYAMTGVAAILAFADMGLSTAVLQFSAHEYAESGLAPTGNNVAMASNPTRQDALLLFALRRIGMVCLVGVPLVFAVGLWTMGRGDGGSRVAWVMPWATFCLASALTLMVSVMLSFREGQDGVWPVQRLRAAMAVMTLLATFAGVALGLGIWTLPLASIATSSLGFGILRRSHLPDLRRLRAVPPEATRLWSVSMSSILSRYSMSWVGGYIMFQIFAPLTMYFKGPVLAGRVGLTVSIFTAIFSIANVWSTFRLPQLSMAVTRHNGPLLRSIFLTGMAASLATYVVMAGILLTAYFVLDTIPEVARRLLGPLSFLMLALGWGFQVVVHNASLFLRAFKVDPLVLATWLAAIHTVGGAILFFYLDRPQLMFVAFASSYMWMLPITYVLCCRRMRDVSAWPTSH